MKVKMEAYCHEITQKLGANMKQRTDNFESSEKSLNKLNKDHSKLSETMSNVYSTHRHETLEFQRRFMASNSAWLEETTSNIGSIGKAAENALTTHSDAFSTTRDEMSALRRELNEFKTKIDERHHQMGDGLSQLIENLSKLVSFQSETKSFIDARLTDWDVRHTEMVRRSDLASERAHDEAAWMRRQCDEMENALRDSNETFVRATHNKMVDENLKYIEQAEQVTKSIGDNYAITNNNILESLKKLYSVRHFFSIFLLI